MIKRTSRPTSNFYCLNNAIVSDKELSWAARGLLVFLLTKPDNWRISLAHLIAETKSAIGKKSGRDNVYALLNELISAGYVARKEIRSELGKINELDYIISEVKVKDGVVVPAETTNTARVKPLKTANATQRKNIKKQSVGFDSPLTENPYTAKPDTANQTLTKNEIKQERNEEQLPTSPANGLEIQPAIRSSFSFDPNSLEIDSGIVGKLESKALKEYLAKALDERDMAQVVLDEVSGKIRAGKALGHDKPIKTVIGYTTGIVSRLQKGGFVESHALSERTRRERIKAVQQNQTEFVNNLAPYPASVSVPLLPERTVEDKTAAETAKASIFAVLGIRRNQHQIHC